MPLRQSGISNNGISAVDSEALFQIEDLEYVNQRYLSDTEESDEGNWLQLFHVLLFFFSNGSQTSLSLMGFVKLNQMLDLACETEYEEYLNLGTTLYMSNITRRKYQQRDTLHICVLQKINLL